MNPTTNQLRLGKNDAATSGHKSGVLSAGNHTGGDYTDEMGNNPGTSPSSRPHVNNATTQFAVSNR